MRLLCTGQLGRQVEKGQQLLGSTGIRDFTPFPHPGFFPVNATTDAPVTHEDLLFALFTFALPSCLVFFPQHLSTTHISIGDILILRVRKLGVYPEQNKWDRIRASELTL